MDGALDRPGRTRSGRGRNPAGIPQRIASRRLAAYRGSRLGPLDATIKYDAHDVAEGAVVSTIAWLCWLVVVFWMTIQYGRGGWSPGRNQTEA